ncbi:hypothetical protein GOP47_0001168 [Adiantum capillus-veneris]|uniref:Pentatricopeptide repeat-containing protein n=1 Tax=Adiantum capillus-veneris TaxID=13818 RepID=A0A9D4ZR85_ADICA|nr:hypothetical protein GOP47_0001168 [Adiantum capillus-veneris]
MVALQEPNISGVQSCPHSTAPSKSSPSNSSSAFAEVAMEMNTYPHFAQELQVKQRKFQAERSLVSDKNVIASLLQDNISLTEGELLHGHIVENGLDEDIFLANLLVSMYGRFGLVEEAGWVFEAIPCRSIVSWSAIISAYTEHGHFQKAIALFHEMHQAGLKPNNITFVRILTACANQCVLEDGRFTHALLIEHGTNIDTVLGTALLTMYGKCWELEAARQVFNSMPEHDIISWNAMIAASKHNEDNLSAGFLFELMQEREVQPNRSTILSTLAAYASTGAINKGRLIHDDTLKGGLDSDTEVANALIHMYGMCNALEEADCVFRHIQHLDVVSWNSMIAACAPEGFFREAYGLFQQMQNEHVQPTRATYLNMLSTCTAPEALSVGKSIHAHISQAKFDSDMLVATALVEMYGKCGGVEDARNVFDNIDGADVICWNAIIASYAQQGQSMQAVKLFQKMLQIGLHPDKMTLSSILSACTDLEYLSRGKVIHAYIVENRFDSDIVIVHALIHMYGKCGNLSESRVLFDKLNPKELTSWNAMITAYSQQGHGIQAIELYEEMLCKNVRPDEVTFVSLLSACSHAGLVDLGYGYFTSMGDMHDLTPLLGHYICLIDLFGRAGWLDVAEDLVQVMPYKATSSVWSTLLSGCRLHKDLERAKRVAEKLSEVEQMAEAWVLL